MEIFQTILTIGGYCIAGGFALISLFGNSKKKLNEEDDQTASRLISNLKSTVDLQEKTLKKIEEDNRAHTKARDEEIRILRTDLDHLRGRNGLLEELFKGQNPDMQRFFKESPKLIEISHSNNDLLKQSIEATNSLAGIMTDFLKQLEKVTPGYVAKEITIETSNHQIPGL